VASTERTNGSPLQPPFFFITTSSRQQLMDTNNNLVKRERTKREEDLNTNKDQTFDQANLIPHTFGYLTTGIGAKRRLRCFESVHTLSTAAARGTYIATILAIYQCIFQYTLDISNTLEGLSINSTYFWTNC